MPNGGNCFVRGPLIPAQAGIQNGSLAGSPLPRGRAGLSITATLRSRLLKMRKRLADRPFNRAFYDPALSFVVEFHFSGRAHVRSPVRCAESRRGRARQSAAALQNESDLGWERCGRSSPKPACARGEMHAGQAPVNASRHRSSLKRRLSLCAGGGKKFFAARPVGAPISPAPPFHSR
jgi:hypothetical protein